MLRTLLRIVFLVLTLGSIVLLISPGTAFDWLGTAPPVSEGVARMIGFAGMFIFFAMFSGRSRFGEEGTIRQPEAQVDHLLPFVPPDIASLLAEPAVLRRVVALTVERRKIEAVKAVRTAARTDLKDAKELVERIQAALPSTRN
jgi:hypothetical protein